MRTEVSTQEETPNNSPTTNNEDLVNEAGVNVQRRRERRRDDLLPRPDDNSDHDTDSEASTEASKWPPNETQ